MTLFEGGETRDIPAVAKEVFDVTGAGDTVIAVLTLSVAAGGSVHDAAVLANHAAGLVVGKLGTASVDVIELLAAIGRGGSDAGIESV
jgi:D-beta-D-heptose 7-phosphate kinase/D-beta-D-heptose 1-phosphate adenosyltransferase